MTSPVRLTLLFVATVLGGIAATLLVPMFAPSYAIAHAQGTAAAPALPAAYPRAVSAEPVTWTRAVATRALMRGDTLRADDFTLADTAVRGRLPYGIDTTTPEAGWLVHRAVAAGEWLRAPAVTPRPAITAGRPVHAVWFDGAVRVSVAAVALNSAAVGGPVSVRVGRTRRLDGIAIAPDSVRLR